MDKKEFEKIGIKNVDEFDKYFEITSIKDEGFLLRQVRRKIADKFDHVIQMLTHYIEPDGLTQFNDAHALSEDDRNDVMRILKEFSILYKEHVMLEIESSDNEEKEYCRKSLDIYKANIKALKSLLVKIKESYSKEESIKTSADYLG